MRRVQSYLLQRDQVTVMLNRIDSKKLKKPFPSQNRTFGTMATSTGISTFLFLLIATPARFCLGDDVSFTAIDLHDSVSVRDPVQHLTINPLCPISFHEFNHTVPNWTIEPTLSTVQVLTSPPDLVEAFKTADGELFFHYTEAAFNATLDQSGVKIRLPSAQLETVTIVGPHKVQLIKKDEFGFPNLNKLTVDNTKNNDHTSAVLLAAVDANEIQLSTAGDQTVVELQTTSSTSRVELRARGEFSQHDISIRAGTVTGTFDGTGTLTVQGSLGVGDTAEDRFKLYGSGSIIVSSNTCDTVQTDHTQTDNFIATGTCLFVPGTMVQTTTTLPLLSTHADNQNEGHCTVELNTSRAMGVTAILWRVVLTVMALLL